jgi:hypothetical protein
VSRRAVLLLLALAVASVALVARREAPPATAASGPGSSLPSPAQRRAPPALDPAAIRDVFRFVEPPPAAEPRPRPTAPVLALATPPPEPFRLVGLVRRQGKLLAAFSLEGEVVLAEAGDDVAGVTLLEVGEEGVRIRRRDGSEGRLALP